jgi:hypothetical protein
MSAGLKLKMNGYNGVEHRAVWWFTDLSEVLAAKRQKTYDFIFVSLSTLGSPFRHFNENLILWLHFILQFTRALVFTGPRQNTGQGTVLTILILALTVQHSIFVFH